MEDKGEGLTFACSDCVQRFITSTLLRIHVAQHKWGPHKIITESDGTRRFACLFEGCGKVLKDRKVLRKHLLTHRPRAFVCEQPGCNKSFYENAKLKRHMLVHTGEKIFNCTFQGCNKKFAYKANLKTHLRTHTGYRPYKCTYPGCDKAFAQASNRNSHVQTHTAGKKRKRCTTSPTNLTVNISDAKKPKLKSETLEKECDNFGSPHTLPASPPATQSIQGKKSDENIAHTDTVVVDSLLSLRAGGGNVPTASPVLMPSRVAGFGALGGNISPKDVSKMLGFDSELRTNITTTGTELPNLAAMNHLLSLGYRNSGAASSLPQLQVPWSLLQQGSMLQQQQLSLQNQKSTLLQTLLRQQASKLPLVPSSSLLAKEQGSESK